MKKDNKLSKKDIDYGSIFILGLSVLAVFFVMWTFTGQWPWKGQSYNSYILQAQSWLDGRLDLGKNYPHLELAIFNGKYYVSFPPFPSYIMLPFVLIGWNACDGFIALISALAAAVYAFGIAEHFGIKKERAIFFALFLTVGSNWLFTVQNAWVWFIAQNLAFTLSLMAIYYALKGKAGLSFAFWACAVGCRPIMILHIFVILYILYTVYKKENPSLSFIEMIKKHWKSVIPMALIALSYMILNYARFGNPTEFGHNYLPEFMRVETGQFSGVYMKENIKHLFRLPIISLKEAWEYQSADGTCMFIASPIFISYIAYIIRSFVKKEKTDVKLLIMIFVIIAAELLITTAHKTMGGSHFGNRYTNDVLPLAFLGLLMTIPKESKWENINHILLIFGASLNIIGSVMYFTK